MNECHQNISGAIRSIHVTLIKDREVDKYEHTDNTSKDTKNGNEKVGGYPRTLTTGAVKARVTESMCAGRAEEAAVLTVRVW